MEELIEYSKSYVILDTNILLLDHYNMVELGKDGTIVVLPETVLDEMDSKKSLMTELGYQARAFGRLLTKANVVDNKKIDNGSVSVLILDGVTILVVSLTKYETLEGHSYSNDRKILEVCTTFVKLAECVKSKVTFISNDVMARLRGMSLGLNVAPLEIVDNTDNVFTRSVEVPYDVFHSIHNSKAIDVLPNHVQGTYNYHITNEQTAQVKLCTIENGIVKVIGAETEKDLRRQDVNPCNAQQLFLAKAIQDPLIDIVVCEALSGSGKTLVTLSNAIRLVRQGKHNSIVYIRNSVNDLETNEEIGFLSGNDEKVNVYLHPLEDTLEYLVRDKLKGGKYKGKELEEKVQEGIEKLKADCSIQGIISLGLRGRTFTDSVIIIDEVQNFSPSSLQKVLTRVGKGCKVILIGSNKQIDNAYITKHNNGLSVLLSASRLEQEVIKMHVVDLHKVVRSPVAEFAEKLFSKDLKL